jgi:hypothetical protein
MSAMFKSAIGALIFMLAISYNTSAQSEAEKFSARNALYVEVGWNSE